MSFILAPLATPRQLRNTPSSQDGIPPDLEADLRAFGAQLIQEAGTLAQLPQVAMATAQVLFQRFWFVSSLRQFGIRDIGMGALYLATKLEECPLRLRDLTNAYSLLITRIHWLLTPPPRQKFSYTPQSYHSSLFYELKELLVIGEMQVLKRLSFNVQVQHPYATLVPYAQMLGLVNREGVVECAWGFLNDSLQTVLPALFAPSPLAAAALLYATRTDKIPLPDRWWELFDVQWDDMVAIVGVMEKHWERLKGGEGKQVWGMSEREGVREWLAQNREWVERNKEWLSKSETSAPEGKS